MAKTHDLCVAVGEYNGKKRYENVGVVLDNGNGPMLLLKRTFNPAGVPNPDGKDSIIISMFEPREKSQQGQQSQQRQDAPNYDDSIPF